MFAYLDNSATTKPCKNAVDRMTDCLENFWGNPSSLHDKGIEAETLLNKAREGIAKVLSCSKDEIIFTSGGTESNNLAILGAARAAKRKGNKVITTCIEHHSVLNAFDELEKEGFEVVRISADGKGRADMEELKNAVDGRTVLISMMAVNNEVGTVEPVSELTSVVRAKNSPALIHIDAVQAFGKIPLNAKKLGADLISVSSHKIHGPKGVGALYVKKGTKLSPLVHGGGQEKDLRPGTEAMPAIAGFLGAAEELNISSSLKKVTELRDYLREKLSEIQGIVINSPDDALAYILNISLVGYRSETLLNFLSEREIYVSSGSACAKGHKSHVLSAMKLPESIIDSSLRVSLSRFTTKEEIDCFLDGIKTAMKVIMKK